MSFLPIMFGLAYHYYQLGEDHDPEIPSRTEDIPPIPSTITVTTRPRQRGGRSRPGGDDSKNPHRDTGKELRHMLGVLRGIEPIGPEEWQRVVEQHAEAFPKRRGDDADTLRRTFHAWCRDPIPTEDPTCPWYVKEVRAIKQLIDQKAAKLGVVVVEEESKETLEDDIDDGESVTSTPPRTADSIRKTFYAWCRDPIPTEDPACPWHVKRARAIKKLIDQKAAERGVVLDEDGKEIPKDDVDNVELVTSTTPRAPPPAFPAQQPLDGVAQPGKSSRPTREESDSQPPLPAAAAAAAAPAAFAVPSLLTLPNNPSPTEEESEIASTSSYCDSSLARKRARVLDVMKEVLAMQREAAKEAAAEREQFLVKIRAITREAAAERKQLLENLRGSIRNATEKDKKKRKRREPVGSSSSSNDNEKDKKKRKRREPVDSSSSNDNETKKRKRREPVDSSSSSNGNETKKPASK